MGYASPVMDLRFSMISNLRWVAATVLPLLLVARLGTGCSPANTSASAGSAAAPAVVTVAPPQSIAFTPTETLSGRIEAVESVEIRPRVSGYLTEVRFQAGQMVRKGQVLFVIDPRPFAAVVQRAEAEVELAKVRLASAERESGRAEQMLKTQAISVEGADQRVSRFGESKAALAAAMASSSGGSTASMIAAYAAALCRVFLNSSRVITGCSGPSRAPSRAPRMSMYPSTLGFDQSVHR